MRKPWAYLEEFGSERTSARSVTAKRDRFYRGGTDGKTYWSSHVKGQRKRMHHVNHATMPHFRYNNSADEHGGGPGESLAHRLFKEAVAGVAQTRLCLGGKLGDQLIRVKRSEIEPAIAHPARTYYSDVRLEFESDGELSFKWNGELHVEVLNTHLVDPEKHDHIRELRIPLVEIRIHEKLAYEYGEDETTDEREAAYVTRIRTWLESERGFLAGIVLSDPNSPAYLEKELRQKSSLLARAEQERSDLARNIAVLNEILREKDRALEQGRAQLAAARDRADGFETQSERLSAESARLKAQLEKLVPELTALREAENGWMADVRWVSVIYCGGAAALWLVIRLLDAWRG